MSFSSSQAVILNIRLIIQGVGGVAAAACQLSGAHGAASAPIKEKQRRPVSIRSSALEMEIGARRHVHLL